MACRAKRHQDQALGSANAPTSVDDIPKELLRIYQQPRDDDNVVNKAIYHQLIKRYIAENNDWPSELQDEFKSEDKLLEYRISKSTGFCSLHKISRWMFRETTWARFWTLRVIFGPIACANQGWFDEFSREYPMALDDAPVGIVPANFAELFALREWTPEDSQMERWMFHSTNTTRYGKRKAVKVMTVDRKKPKLRASSSMAASNTDTPANIPTATAFAVDLTIPVRDKRSNASSQGSAVHGRVPQTSHQQDNQEFSGSIKLMEEAIERCNALHQAQVKALELLRNQLQLVKNQYNAKGKQLGEHLDEERRNKDALEDSASRIERAIKREDR